MLKLGNLSLEISCVILETMNFESRKGFFAFHLIQKEITAQLEAN